MTHCGGAWLRQMYVLRAAPIGVRLISIPRQSAQPELAHLNPDLLKSALLNLAVLTLALLIFSASGQARQPAQSLVDSLETRITELRSEGRFEPALDTAHRLLSARRQDSTTLPWQLGDAERLVSLLESAAAMIPADQARLAIADSLDQVVVDEFGSGRFAHCIELGFRQLEIRRDVWGEVHQDIARVQNRLGAFYWRQGDFERAVLHGSEALALNRRILGVEHPHVASCLHNLGTYHRIRGNYAEAEAMCTEGLALRRRVLPADHPDIAWSLNNLAGLYIGREEYAAAEPLLREALQTLTGLLGEDHPEVAQVRHNIANTLLAQKKDQEAEVLIRQSLAVSRSVGNGENPYVAGGLHALGSALLNQGKLTEAEQSFREALALDRRLLGEEHPHVAWVLTDLASCLQTQGAYARAESLLARAALVHDRASLRVGAGYARASFRSPPHSRLAANRLLLGQDERAWQATEAGRGRVLFDFLNAAGKRSLTAAEHAREDSLEQLLGQLERRLAARQRATADSTREGRRQVEELRTQLLATETAWSSYQRELAARHPVTQGAAFPLDRIRASIDNGAAIVGWVHEEIAHEQLATWGFVLRADGPVRWTRLDPACADATADSLEQSAKQFKEALSIAGAWPFRVTDFEPIERSASSLFAYWWEPLETHLHGIDKVIVIPSAPLLGLPLEALCDTTGHYLGDRYQITYIPSATVYAWLRETRRTGSDTAIRQALLLGDPALPDDRLPKSRFEVQRVATMVDEATILIDTDASERALVELAERDALADFQLIHLATHARVDDEDPGRSALLLVRDTLPDSPAAATAGDRLFDGVLTVKEIVRGWRLEAELVTLSCCESALGVESSSEGYIGLVHAFLQVGARNLLVSLWKVEEDAALLLMQRFYENLTGTYADSRGRQHGAAMAMPQALREARTWLREYTDADGEHPFAHPAYWAGFILVGGS